MMGSWLFLYRVVINYQHLYLFVPVFPLISWKNAFLAQIIDRASHDFTGSSVNVLNPNLNKFVTIIKIYCIFFFLKIKTCKARGVAAAGLVFYFGITSKHN